MIVQNKVRNKFREKVAHERRSVNMYTQEDLRMFRKQEGGQLVWSPGRKGEKQKR
jgi:hypothetical protein